MPNVTLSVDEEVIKKVRKIAVEKNTTLTAMIREYLNSVAAQDALVRDARVKELQQSFSELSRDMGGRQWKREELYER